MYRRSFVASLLMYDGDIAPGTREVGTQVGVEKFKVLMWWNVIFLVGFFFLC